MFLKFKIGGAEQVFGKIGNTLFAYSHFALVSRSTLRVFVVFPEAAYIMALSSNDIEEDVAQNFAKINENRKSLTFMVSFSF